MKPKINPLFVSNSDGKQIAVQLKIEEFELITKLLGKLDQQPEKDNIHQKVDAEVVNRGSSNKSKMIFGKTKAELDFEKSDMDVPDGDDGLEQKANIKPNNFYTKSIITMPVPFEMNDEFCSAKGVLLADGSNFKVLAGSKASCVVDRALPGKTRYVREELEMLGVLVDDTKHGDMIFTRDYQFENPNDAASVIAGAPRDGRHCWIAVENGKPMRQY